MADKKDKPKSRPKSKSITDIYIYGGLASLGILGVGAYLFTQDHTIIKKLLGQQPAQAAIPQEDLEKEEQEALERGMNPYTNTNSGVPGGYGSGPSQVPQPIRCRSKSHAPGPILRRIEFCNDSPGKRPPCRGKRRDGEA